MYLYIRRHNKPCQRFERESYDLPQMSVSCIILTVMAHPTMNKLHALYKYSILTRKY
jgi:hypothetical protein